MAKQLWKPGNMIYPLPAVMVSVTDGEGNDNIITVAWTGTVCTNPAMAYISVRPSRYSYDMIRKTGEFVINLTTEELAFATDFCGVRSGRDVDKFRKLNLTKEKAQFVSAPMIGELDTETISEFFYAVSYSAAMNLHFKVLSGTNSHHICEAMFKAFAKALDMAVSVDPRITDVLSTKGSL